MAQNAVTPSPTFASLNALGPRMIKLYVADISTVSKPSTAADTTAALTIPLESTALRASVAACC